MIIARTDARNATGLEGHQAFEEGVKRLKAALEAGADMAFMESPNTVEECKELVQSLAPHPVLINILPNGLTPALKTNECTDLGFKAVIYPCTGFIPAMLAMQKSYAALKNDGTDLDCCGGKQIKDFFGRMGLESAFGFDKNVVGKAQKEIHKKYE